MKIMDSTLPENFSRGLYEQKGYDLAPNHLEKIIDTIFTGTSNLLSQCKSKEHPVAVVFETIGDKIIAAAMEKMIRTDFMKY